MRSESFIVPYFHWGLGRIKHTMFIENITYYYTIYPYPYVQT